MIIINPDDIGENAISKSFQEEDLENLDFNINAPIENGFLRDYKPKEVDEYPGYIERKLVISNEEIYNNNRKILKLFLRSKKRNGCSDQTIYNYRLHLKQFLSSILKPVNEITSIDIYNYLDDYKLSHKISNNTLDNIRIVFNNFFNYLEEEDIILKSPCRKIHKIKGEQVVKTPFLEEEIELIRDICPTMRELALVDFLNSSGVRVSECVKLNINDISFENKEGIVFGKGAKERIIYFDARTKVHLQKYLDKRDDDCPALFTTVKHPIQRLSKTGIEYIVAELGREAGVKGAHPHRYRRSLATRLLEKGVPIEQVQRILGHAKLETTLIYAKVNQCDVKRNHERFCS